MSLETNGTWEAGVWATTVWASGVWYEGAYVGYTYENMAQIPTEGFRLVLAFVPTDIDTEY